MLLNSIDKAYFNNSEVDIIYLGDALIYPTTPPTPPPHDYSQDYLTIVSREDNNTIDFNTGIPNLEMSVDGVNWTAASSVTLNSGNTAILRRDQVFNIQKQLITGSTGTYNVEGNSMSLLYGDNFSGGTVMPLYGFVDLFNGCTGLTDASNLILPALRLSDRCYAYMFAGCTSLTKAPELPATILAQMCYDSMFSGCTSLTTAPELPATTLYWSCYHSMFSGCTSLTTAPELPATTLTGSCYDNMFSGCTSLSSVTCLAEDISAQNCTMWWLDGVSPTGTFYKSPNMSSWTSGISGIPTGWTVVDYQG